MIFVFLKKIMQKNILVMLFVCMSFKSYAVTTRFPDEWQLYGYCWNNSLLLGFYAHHTNMIHYIANQDVETCNLIAHLGVVVHEFNSNFPGIVTPDQVLNTKSWLLDVLLHHNPEARHEARMRYQV